jgi:broad specificity phosphatase PhoE
MARLYIFRHGETDWNLARRIQGHTDIALNERGRDQARDLANRLERYPIQAILSSDLARARETAEIVARRSDVPVFVDERLREASLGDAEGLTVDEAIARFGAEAWQTWCSADSSDWGFSFPNGEAKRSTLGRAQAVLEDFLRRHPFEHVGVSTHGGVIRTLILSCVPWGDTPVGIQNCGLHILDGHNNGRSLQWEYIETNEPEESDDAPEF